MTNVTPIKGDTRVVAADKRRTVTLTNARPVEFTESEWPVIAEGAYKHDHPSGCEYLEVTFRVRMGKHDRYIIHGKFYYWVDDDEERCVVARVGKYLSYNSGDEVEGALLAVGNEMRERVHNEHLRRWITPALDSCFAKLGPQLL